MPKKTDDNIETEYWETITLTDPTTGQTFTQKVKITRYKTPAMNGKSVSEEIEEDTIVPLPEEEEIEE